MYKAIIFDLDGVLCFTDEYHYLAWKSMADSIGVYFDREINNRLRGVSRMDSLDIILERYDGVLSAAEKEELANQKNEIYKNYLGQMSREDLSEDIQFTLNELRRKGLALAVGSSSKNAPLILDRIGLSNFFDAVSDGNNITKSKPDPEVFVKASQMLCIPFEDCLVVEDAISGVEAAHAAGMKVACVGDAALENAGDYNMCSLPELLNIV